MRNSEKRTAEDSDMSDGSQDVSALLADLKKQLAEVTSGSFDRDETPKRFQKKKERLAKENKSKFNIEPQHNFNLEEDTQSQRKVLSQQQQQQSYNQQQQRNQFNQQQPQKYNNQQQYYNQQQQFNNNNNPGQFQQLQFSGTRPRQLVQGRGESQPNALFNQFGDAMGPDANVDPEANQYPTQPQLNPRQQSADNDGDDLRCINKVMQVEETVYEEKVKCTHKFSEKCHDTFITDYVPTQERKCETSFDKNCRIRYRPMMFEEDVEICNEPLKKVCNNETVGQGETVYSTHYETVCETRYKEHEVEQDDPVCEMVIEKKCKQVTIPVPSGPVFRRRRQTEANIEEPSNPLQLTGGNLGPAQGLGPDLDYEDEDENSVNIGEECEEWPVQKCELVTEKVKKTNPETACEKIPKEICAPSGCVVEKSEKACRTETKALQNIPQEECDLEPQEHCKKETVLVPRLVQQPNCIKVPKEVCVNERTNPKKVTRPVVKEWCYKPSDLKSPTSRLALSQFFSKN